MEDKDPLVSELEKAEETKRGLRLDNPKVMPTESVCCTRCSIATWQIVDRTLICYCPRTGKMSWAGGELMTTVSTTGCGYYLRQEAERELERRERARQEGEGFVAMRGHQEARGKVVL